MIYSVFATKVSVLHSFHSVVSAETCRSWNVYCVMMEIEQLKFREVVFSVHYEVAPSLIVSISPASAVIVCVIGYTFVLILLRCLRIQLASYRTVVNWLIDVLVVLWQLKEVYTLLNENYVEDDDNMFRFDYSPEFLHWSVMIYFLVETKLLLKLILEVDKVVKQ